MEDMSFAPRENRARSKNKKKMPPDEKQRHYFLTARSCVCDQASFCVRAESSDFVSRR